jgi:hypothetical protein
MVAATGYLTYFNPPALSGLAPNLQWYVLGIMASLLVVTVHALLLAFGRAFNLQELEKYAKAEILNAIATILMVMFLITLLNQVEYFSLTYFLGCQNVTSTKMVCPEFKCGGQTIAIDQLTNSIGLLQCRLSDKAAAFAELHQQLMGAAVDWDPFSVFNRLNMYISILGIPIFSGQYVSSWFREAETYRLLNIFITNLLVGLNALVVVADYVKATMLTFFLPLGLILRAFHFTRGIGAFFMSLAIGMYFVYPVLYIITDPAFVKPTYNPSVPIQTGQPLCFPTFSSVSYSLYSTVSSSESSGSTDLSLSQLSNDVANIYATLLLQPFIIFAVTMVFVRYMTYILGGEPADLLRALAKVV